MTDATKTTTYRIVQPATGVVLWHGRYASPEEAAAALAAEAGAGPDPVETCAYRHTSHGVVVARTGTLEIEEMDPGVSLGCDGEVRTQLERDTITLSPDHQLLRDLDLPASVTAVEIVPGVTPACARHLDGTGVPVVLYARTASGTLGTGAHPGIVVELDHEELVAAGLDDTECWLARGANLGTYADSEGPCCGDCLAAGGEYDEEAPEWTQDQQGPCWSCVQMVEEAARAAANLRDASLEG